MKIKLARTGQGVLFEAENERGHRVLIEGSGAHGGTDTAPSPTEYLMISQMGCTAIDVVELLRKMRQPPTHIEIDAEGFRAEDQVPRIFTRIHLHYRIYGRVQPEKAQKAIDMSISTYCTVSKMIDRVARITTSLEILPEDSVPAGVRDEVS